MEANDWAICSLVIVSSAGVDGSGVALGGRAAFSVATTDKGRCRGRSEACDLGRCCHDNVPVREGIAFEGESFVGELRLLSESILTRPSFSLVGEPVKRDIASSISASRGSESARGCIVGRVVCDRLLGCVDIRDVVGVVDGDDLVGEIERARSAKGVVKMNCHVGFQIPRRGFTYLRDGPAFLFDLAISPPRACGSFPRPPDLACRPVP